MNGARMNETQLAKFFLQGHDEVVARAHRMMVMDADLFAVLKGDHQAVMDRLDRICDGGSRDLVAMRPDFLEMKSLLEAHSLAEERALYARLKLKDETRQLALEAGGDHEMVARMLEDMSGLGLDAKQWLTLANGLRDLVREHVETEESEIFERARAVFDQETLHEMAMQMQVEKARSLMIVA